MNPAITLGGGLVCGERQKTKEEEQLEKHKMSTTEALRTLVDKLTHEAYKLFLAEWMICQWVHHCILQPALQKLEEFMYTEMIE